MLPFHLSPLNSATLSAASYLLIDAIEADMDSKEQEIEKLIKLFTLEWDARVYSAARLKLQQNKTVTANPMPLT